MEFFTKLEDRAAEQISGGSGASVVEIMNPQKGNAAFNYGQSLKVVGLSAKESSDADGDSSSLP